MFTVSLVETNRQLGLQASAPEEMTVDHDGVAWREASGDTPWEVHCGDVRGHGIGGRHLRPASSRSGVYLI